MREPRRIGIVGLGLIGGSLALALRRAESRAQSRSARSGRVRFEIVGVDTHEKTLDDAASSGAIDLPALPRQAPLERCDLVVLCLPAPALLESLPGIAARMRPGALLTDVCGVKELPAALGAAQKRVVFVGAHPMAGREERGFSAARADLFDGACVALCPAVGASEGNQTWATSARAAVRALWSEAGAGRFLELSAREHDRAVAYASHLPALAAAALFAALEGAGAAGPIARALAAGGFRDTTRLAADGTVGQAAVHNRFIPGVLRALGGELEKLAGQIEQGQREPNAAALEPLARKLERLADRRRAMPLPPRK